MGSWLPRRPESEVRVGVWEILLTLLGRLDSRQWQDFCAITTESEWAELERLRREVDLRLSSDSAVPWGIGEEVMAFACMNPMCPRRKHRAPDEVGGKL
jgi:hypothetical protein